jgi:tryptophan 2,3-dioxygenase
MSETRSDKMRTNGTMADGDASYGSYLYMPELTACQHPRSEEHDEMLFIIIHQASELWLKLSLHELGAARYAIQADELDPALKMFARVSRVIAQLTQSWDVLATMTPADYHRFRPFLGTSSGFQSAQYRQLEFLLGARNAQMIDLQPDSRDAALLRQELVVPSLYDEVLRLIGRRGFPVPGSHLERDFSLPYEASEEVEACWLQIYQNPKKHWQLYDLAEKLVDLEYQIQRWRFGHLKTVERIIGYKQGTGGTPGVPYLEAVLKRRFFPELLTLRTAI